MMLAGMLLAYSVIFGLLLAVACRKEWKKNYVWVKALCSFAFLLVLFIFSYQSGNVIQMWKMVPAFLCCFVGDIFMAVYNRLRKKIHFLMGLSIFLIGHLCFVRWLCTLQRITAIDVVIPFLAVLVTGYLVSRKDVHTGRLKPFILIYAFFVAQFCTKGQHLLICNATISNAMIAVGSALFLASDISIIFLYFQKRKGVLVHIFNLSTYYYGMFLLASQLYFL